MKKILAAGAAAFALCGASALAADFPVKASPGPLFNWSGCYVGGHGGYARTRANDHVNFDDVGVTGETLFISSYTPKGGIYGLQGGCDYQAGTLVIGIEGDYSWSRMRDPRSLAVGDDPNQTFSFQLDHLSSVRGRLGLTGILDNRLLLYATGGAAWGGFKYSFVLNDADAGVNAQSLLFTAQGTVF